MRKDLQVKQLQVEVLEERLYDIQGHHQSSGHQNNHDHEHKQAPFYQPESWLPDARVEELSLTANFSAGCGTETDDVVGQLQGGAHDPDRCGFNFQSAELSFSGAVDRHLQVQAHVLFSEGHVEVEEVFAVANRLPYGLELKGGYFLTEFGAFNASHPHSWAWLDQPVINGRVLGSDGLRGSGARVGWTAPFSWHSQLLFGIQNANDSTMTSFRGSGHSHGHDDHAEHDHDHDHGHDHEESLYEGVGGAPVIDQGTRGLDDLLYLVRWQQEWLLSSRTVMKWGLSGLFGPNRSGKDSETRIYGTDLTLHWMEEADHHTGPLLTWQTELMWRDYEVAPWVDDDLQLRKTGLKDWGIYSQFLYKLHPAWSLGLRYEYATGRKELPMLARQDDPLRSDRQRVSPLLIWNPTHSTRLRFQYNYDDADFLEDRAHTFWFGFEFVMGTHHDH